MLIISKIKGVLVLKDAFSKTKYVLVLKYQISSFYRNSSEVQTGVNFAPSLPSATSKQTPKKPTQIRVKQLVSSAQKEISGANVYQQNLKQIIDKPQFNKKIYFGNMFTSHCNCHVTVLVADNTLKYPHA